MKYDLITEFDVHIVSYGHSFFSFDLWKCTLALLFPLRTGEVRRLLPSASLRVTCGQGVVPGEPPDQGYVKSGERVVDVF